MKNERVLPLFNLSFGITLSFISIIIIIPIICLILSLQTISYEQLINILNNVRITNSFKLSIYAALIAALINGIIGTSMAWMLVRYNFWGNKLIDAMIDLPLAMPTAVAGIALTTIYAPDGIIGRFFTSFNINIAFTPIGIVIALMFVGLPFVIRTVEPVIRNLDKYVEESAMVMGANNFQIFCKVILPNLLPSIITGIALALSRGLGEYGSVIFIAGNMPNYTEILPLLIFINVEQFDYATASILAITMLFFAFIILLSINIMKNILFKHMN
jgi:sulfate/thiosulfate transport system permease protein